MLLYGLYYRFDRKLLRSLPNDAFARVDIQPLLKNSHLLEVAPIRKKFVDRFEGCDVDQIKAAGLDVLLRFGFGVIKGEILNCARYGVWSFHHGDSREYRGLPPLFWEIYERNPVSGTILQVLNETLDGGRVLYRSRSATDFSWLCKNQNNTYWKTANFVSRSLRQLYASGWESITKRNTYNEQTVYNKPLYRAPSNRQMLLFFFRQVALWSRRRIDNLFKDQWFLAVRSLDSGKNGADPIIKPVYPPRGEYYADPFLFSCRGRQFVFLERYCYQSCKGTIAYMEMDASGNLSDPVEVLERPYHLSYPFLFEWESDIFMMPETHDHQTVEVYRAVEFPHGWELHCTMLSNVKAVDPTLLRHGGKFWLFTSMRTESLSTSDELFLFHSDTPLGPWQPHPLNPIVSDICRARPAGRLIQKDGHLIRPSQDCSGRYGRRINLNRVEVLTETEYQESPAGKIDPDWIRGIVATHTITQDENLQVLDGCRRIFRYLPVMFPARVPRPTTPRFPAPEWNVVPATLQPAEVNLQVPLTSGSRGTHPPL